MTQLILATTSRARIEFFLGLNIPFSSESSEVDEYIDSRPSDPEGLVKFLSQSKAEAVAKKHSDGIIIGFDSVMYFNGKILEKPKDRAENFSRLKMLSGNSHEFYTGVHLIYLDKNKTLSRVVKTTAHLRRFSDNEINKYLDQDPNFVRYALGYDPAFHYSSTFIEKIDGSIHNICRGLPVETVVDMLKEIGYKI